MKVVNRSNNAVVAKDADLAESFLSRLVGLLGRPSLGHGEALIITPCTSIHTFFMRFSIDAVFFDGRYRAVAVVEGLKPWRVTRLYPKARGVIELPAGSLKGSPVLPGDQLEIS